MLLIIPGSISREIEKNNEHEILVLSKKLNLLLIPSLSIKKLRLNPFLSSHFVKIAITLLLLILFNLNK